MPKNYFTSQDWHRSTAELTVELPESTLVAQAEMRECVEKARELAKNGRYFNRLNEKRKRRLVRPSGKPSVSRKKIREAIQSA